MANLPLELAAKLRRPPRGDRIGPHAWVLLPLRPLAAKSRPRLSAEHLGMLGENRAAFELEELQSSGYELYHDLYLPRPDQQGTTQIDHVVLCPYGIFVIETKNLSGWIFGSEGASRWTQALPSGTKRPFQNPLRQNRLHMKALATFLELPAEVFRSVIYLAGSCEFKTTRPDNVLTCGLVAHIESSN